MTGHQCVVRPKGPFNISVPDNGSVFWQVMEDFVQKDTAQSIVGKNSQDT